MSETHRPVAVSWVQDGVPGVPSITKNRVHLPTRHLVRTLVSLKPSGHAAKSTLGVDLLQHGPLYTVSPPEPTSSAYLAPPLELVSPLYFTPIYIR